jgi:hypothetical protein
MIKNLNELLLIEFLKKDYLILKEENSKNSKTLLQNIKYLISFNRINLSKIRTFNILKGSDYNEREIAYFRKIYWTNKKWN